METLKAMVENAGDKYSLRIKVENGDVVIPLSDDNANAVKSGFNKLIQRIRDGEFKVQLDKDGDDLFSMVAKEYLTQLNKEIREVYSQIKEYGLLKKPSDGTA
jgi:ABC-type molybdate transport system ATPase subunit